MSVVENRIAALAYWKTDGHFRREQEMDDDFKYMVNLLPKICPAKIITIQVANFKTFSEKAGIRGHWSENGIILPKSLDFNIRLVFGERNKDWIKEIMEDSSFGCHGIGPLHGGIAEKEWRKVWVSNKYLPTRNKVTVDQIHVVTMYASTKLTADWLKTLDVAVCGHKNRMKHPNAHGPQYAWGRGETEMPCEILRLIESKLRRQIPMRVKKRLKRSTARCQQDERPEKIKK